MCSNFSTKSRGLDTLIPPDILNLIPFISQFVRIIGSRCRKCLLAPPVLSGAVAQWLVSRINMLETVSSNPVGGKWFFYLQKKIEINSKHLLTILGSRIMENDVMNN